MKKFPQENFSMKHCQSKRNFLKTPEIFSEGKMIKVELAF